MTVTFSLIGDNTGTGLSESQTPDANGNLVGQPVGSGGSGIIDPLLGPLANNGGPTQTRALLAHSPALNRGANPAGLTTDQRGGSFVRVAGNRPDMGAFEYQSVVESLVVTTAADENDGTSDPHFGTGTSLREAIAYANSHAGADTITFAISGAGLHTIRPTSALPALSGSTIIDGTTQPGFAVGVPVIELDGSLAGAGVSGLTVYAGSSTVKGLVVNRFAAHGIVLTGGGGNVVAGNFIGTDAAGNADQGNGNQGVFILNSSHNTIGGNTDAAPERDLG